MASRKSFPTAQPLWWSVPDPGITLRPARPEDAPQAAPLIYAAAPALFRLLFGPTEGDAVRFFARLFALPQNPFSYQQATMAECGGTLAGLAIAAPVAVRRRLGRRMFWLVPRLRGAWASWRTLPDGLALMRGDIPSPPDAYYLSILSVRAERRGQGVGTLLLDTVVRQAQNAGCAATVLHVETDNTDALRFYARAGFGETIRAPAVPRLIRQGLSGFVALERRTE